MKFRSDSISNILHNQQNIVGNAIQHLSLDKKIMVAQGYGVSKDVPIRFLSYSIPVLRLARELPSTAKIVFYFAKEGVMRANRIIDSQQINDFNESLFLMQKFLKDYIRQFHSNLRQEVEIVNDIVTTTEVDNAIEHFFPFAKDIYEKNQTIRNFISKRGGESGLRYMLEHAFYMRDPIRYQNSILPNLVPEMKSGFDAIIMVGGLAEKVFFEFRKELIKRTEMHSGWESYQFFTPIGDPPTYHIQQGEPSLKLMDISENSFDELLQRVKRVPNEFGKQRNLVRDYIILLQDIVGVDRFEIELSKVLSGSLESRHVLMRQ